MSISQTVLSLLFEGDSHNPDHFELMCYDNSINSMEELEPHGYKLTGMGKGAIADTWKELLSCPIAPIEFFTCIYTPLVQRLGGRNA